MIIFKKYSSSITDMESLLSCIKEEGSIASSDIDEAIEKKILDKEHLASLLKYIEENNIRYVDLTAKRVKKPYESYESKGAIGLYLREISTLRRLTEEEELALWKELEELNKQKANSKDNEEALKKIENRINLTSNKLVKSNLRLVVSMAKRYCSSGIPFIDLIDEGNIGLIESISRYDYKKGFKFSTYAAWWIKQSITKAVASKRDVIRYPMHIARLIKKYMNTSKDLSQRLNRNPLPQEIADEMGINITLLQSISTFAQGTKSIESSLNIDGKSFNITDFMEDKSYPAPQNKVLSDSLRETIEEALSELTEKERQIIILRFGLNGEKPLKLESTGKELNITRERVRQIQDKTLKKIRNLNLSKELKGFLWD